MTEPRFPFVTIEVSPDDVDYASGLFFELGAAGVEERDATTLNKPGALKVPGSNRVILVGSFSDHETAKAAVATLDATWNPELGEIVGDAWRDAWKEHFRPFAICKSIVIQPPWDTYKGPPVETILELEPGRAFGTGLHETTSLVAGVLEEHRAELGGAEILDVGTGSGILALIALALGAKSARAIDNDADVVGVVNENAERNQKSHAVVADATPVEDIEGTYPIVLANIEAFVLIPLAKAISARTKPGGLLVLSGILVPQKDTVLAAYPDFDLVSAPEKGEWIALALRKKA